MERTFTYPFIYSHGPCDKWKLVKVIRMVDITYCIGWIVGRAILGCVGMCGPVFGEQSCLAKPLEIIPFTVGILERHVDHAIHFLQEQRDLQLLQK